MTITQKKTEKAKELLNLSSDLTKGNVSINYAVGSYSIETVLHSIAIGRSFDTSLGLLSQITDAMARRTVSATMTKSEVDILAVLNKHFDEMDVTGWIAPTMPGEPTEETPNLEFPKGVFDECTEKYIDSVARSQQVDRAAVAVAVLAVLATSVQGKFKIWYPDETNHLHTLNLYCLIAASPSERKSTISKLLMKPVFDWQKEKIESYNELIAKYTAEKNAAESDAAGASKALKSSKSKDLTDEERQELENRIKTATLKKAELKAPESPYHIFSDITPEALAQSLQDCGQRGAIFNDEPSALKIIAGLYNNGQVGNIDIYLHSYDGGFTDVRRAGGRTSIHLDNPLLTMLIYGQPSIINSILTNPELVGNGMISRFCLAYPKSKVEDRTAFVYEKPDENAFKYFSSTIQEYLNIQNPESPKYLHFSKEAIDFLKQDGYLQWLIDLPKKGRPLHDHGEEAGKLHDHFIRICGLLHLLENPSLYESFKTEAPITPIGVDTVTRAIHISKYFVDTLIWFVNRSDNTDTSLLRKVFEAVMEKTVYSGHAFTDIRSVQTATRKTQGLESVKDLKNALYQLQDSGLIAIDDKCTGTRRNLIFINPMAAEKELGISTIDSSNSKSSSSSFQ